MSSGVRPLRVLVIGMCLSVVSTAGLAVGGLRLETGEVAGEGWRAGRTSLHVDLTGERPSLNFELDELSLPPPLAGLERLSGRCPSLEFLAGGIRCPAATVQLVRAGRSLEPFPVSVSVEPAPGDARHLRLEMPPGGGGLRVDVHLHPGGWELRLDGDAVPAAALAPLVTAVVGPEAPVPTRGSAAVAGHLTGGDATPRGTLELQVGELWFADAASLRVGEGVSAALSVALDEAPGGALRADARIQLNAGQVYLDPVFLEVPDTPLSLQLSADWDAAASRLRVERFSFDHPGVAGLRARGVLDTSHGIRWQAGRVELPETRFEPLFATYLQPFLLDGVLGAARVAGRVAVSAEPEPDGRVRLVMHASGLGLDDGAGRFALEGLDGVVHWGGTGTPPSRLAWDSIRVYRVPVGAARVRGVIESDRFRLLAPLTLPLLDGRLEISRFEARGLGSENPAWSLAGALEPLSMEALTEALGWVPMGGTISGEVPAVSYEDHVMRVDGTLLTRVFDGEVSLRALSLERPFGVVPVLRADVEVRDLSLDSLTRAFAFGNIRGRLDGRVTGLVLEDWQPRSFDARFATPPDDTSTHRISQRAVDNLAQIGGAGSAVSSTFLRLFEDFGYDRLGLSCRLRDGICEIGGVAPAREGFYIVRGSGLPRIDVIGYNQRVDWVTLVERLKSMTASEGPVVR